MPDAEDPVGLDTKLWDFSIVTSVNLCIILLLTVRLCHLRHQSALKRNKLTFGLHQWFIFNQIVVQLKATFQILIDFLGYSNSEYLKYLLTTIEAQVFVSASFVQLLEWHLIASLVKFQSE